MGAVLLLVQSRKALYPAASADDLLARQGVVAEAPKTGAMNIRDYIRATYRNLLPLLYARQRYKLFLKTTLENQNLRLLELASLIDYFSNFVRPVPIRAPFGNSLLVVAPHQDDETI